MFVEISRLLFVLVCTFAGLSVGRFFDAATLGGILGTLFGYVAGGVGGRGIHRSFDAVEASIRHVPAAKLFAGSIGAVVGGVAAAMVVAPFALVSPRPVVFVVGALTIWITAALAVRIAVSKSEELLALAGLSSRPLVRSEPYEAHEGHILDTSAVMDGHLPTLVHAGFLDGDLFVPRFVLDELQGFADARGGTQARRARRGLETLEALRREAEVRVRVLDDEIPEHQEVDAKLVTLALRLEIRLLTCDVNLQRVAELRGVPVVNLRRLADELRPERVPGDLVTIEVVRKGKEEGQGVGYLDDGAMVVVNGGCDLVDAGPVEVEISTSIPTAVGQLYFARPVESDGPATPSEETVGSGRQ